MHNIVYAAFDSPAGAEWAMSELFSLGAHAHDVTLVALRTPENPAPEPENGRLSVAHDESPIERPEGALPETPELPEAEDLPTLSTPFGDVPGDPVFVVEANYPGELCSILNKLGVPESIAKLLEQVTMSGGAVLLARTPSGDVDERTAWQTIDLSGGRRVMSSAKGIYLF